MSRVLVGLSVVQILAIAFLSARVIELDSRLRNAEEAAAARSQAAVNIDQQFIPVTPDDAIIAEAAPKSPDAELFRRIVREELAALRPGAATPDADEAKQPPDPRVVDAARRDFDRLISRRRVSSNDLDLYLDKIAELPEAERTKALRELTKAMNDGRIEGRF